MNKPTIFLDIDGVLANWTKAMCYGLNHPYPQNTEFESTYWLRDHFTRKQIDYVADSLLFWESIEKYQWADDIVKTVNRYSNDWFFLTKPMPFVNCWHGKALWVKKHYPKYFNKLIIIQGDKSKCCSGGNSILIDDSSENISDWEKSFGSTFRWKEITSDSKYPAERLDKLGKFLNNYQNKL